MLEKIEKVIREYKGDDGIVITENTSFADLELDSLDTVELIMRLEEELGVTIETTGNITTVGELIGMLNAQLH